LKYSYSYITGKTSRIFYLIEYQLEYPSIYVSFQGVDTNEDRFWLSLGNRILKEAEHLIASEVNIHPQSELRNFQIQDLSSFIEFFALLNKDIVLFIDKFDLALGSDCIDQFFNVLRCLQQGRNTGVRSMVLIGTSNILKATNQTVSSFSICNTLVSPYFTLEECQELFKDFTEKTKVILESGIVDDIFARTQGHPGFVCFCGKKIQEVLLLRSSSLTLLAWQEYAMFELPRLAQFRMLNNH
jgi:hypothetical protein